MKRVKRIEFGLEFNPVAGTKKLTRTIYDVDDDSSAQGYQPMGAVPAERALTAPELAGTLDEFLTACEQAAKDIEGIA
jgi:hypothetical protein